MFNCPYLLQCLIKEAYSLSKDRPQEIPLLSQQQTTAVTWKLTWALKRNKHFPTPDEYGNTMMPKVCWLEHLFTNYWGKKCAHTIKLFCSTCRIYQWFSIANYHKTIIVRRSTVFSDWVTIIAEQHKIHINPLALYATTIIFYLTTVILAVWHIL